MQTSQNNMMNIALLLMIIICNAVAYNVCLDSMQAYDLKWKFFVNVVINSFFFPAFLVFVLYLFKSRMIIVFLHLFVLIFLLVPSVYYNYFQTVPHINMLGYSYLLPSVLDHIFLQLFGMSEFIIVLCIFISVVASLILISGIKNKKYVLMPAKTITTLLLILIIGYLTKWVLINHALGYDIHEEVKLHVSRALKVHGFLPVYTKQIKETLWKKRKTLPWTGKINPQAEVTIAKKKNKNIIIVQVESLEPIVVDLTMDGKYLMPYMHFLKENGLYFDHFFSQHRGGGSSDAELSTFTSLLPLATHPGFSTMDYQRIITLNKTLRDNGYYCAGFHANQGNYFSRTESYQKMGFEYFFDQKYFTGEGAGWYSKDKEFLRQTINILGQLPQPFFAYVITMQSHGPFDNHARDNNTFNLHHYSKIKRDYMLTMHEVDEAFSIFFNLLETKGFLKNTVVLIYGDHATGLMFCNDDAFHGYDRVPLFIVGNDISCENENKVGSHVDIAPTVLDIVGIEEPTGWLGSSLLRGVNGITVLNLDRLVALRNDNNKVVFFEDNEKFYKFLDYSASLLDP